MVSRQRVGARVHLSHLLFHLARGINWEISPSDLTSGGPVNRSSSALQGTMPQVMSMVVLSALGAFAFLLAMVPFQAFSDLLKGTLEPGELKMALESTAGFVCIVLMMSAVRAVRFIRYELVLGKENVEMSFRFLGRVRGQWNEPMANYDGIQFTLEQFITGRKRQPPRMLAAVVLCHADPKKSIRLCETDRGALHPQNTVEYAGGGPFRQTCETYALAFNLPLIEKDSKGNVVVRRGVEDLNTPVGTLVRNGKIGTEPLRGMPPPGVIVEQQDDSTHILLRRSVDGRFIRKLLFFDLLVALFLGILFIAMWHMSAPRSPIFLLAIMLVAAYAGINIIVLAQQRRSLFLPETRITIAPDAIAISRADRKGDILDETKVCLGGLEDIKREKMGLILLTDGGNAEIRTNSQAAAEWLRETILAQAAKYSETEERVPRKKETRRAIPLVKTRGDMAKRPSNKRLSPIQMIFMGGFSLLWGTLACSGIFGAFLGSLQSAKWPSTDGLIRASAKDNLDRANMTYVYSVGGRTFEGHCVGFRDYHNKNGAAVCSRYPVGKTVAVYYNPSTPDDACLEPGFKFSGAFPSLQFVVVGVVFIPFGTILLFSGIGSLFSKRRNKRHLETKRNNPAGKSA